MLLAAAPAIPLHTAGKYVAGAYIVFLALLVIYIAIMATRLSRLDTELADLAELAEAKVTPPAPRNSDEVAVTDVEPAATPATRPGDTGREAEDVTGVARQEVL